MKTSIKPTKDLKAFERHLPHTSKAPKGKVNSTPTAISLGQGKAAVVWLPVNECYTTSVYKEMGKEGRAQGKR